MKKLLLGVIMLGLLGAGVSAVYLRVMYPQNLPPVRPELKVDLSAERLERGRYLANHVTVCMDCHSRRDWSQWAGPLVPGTEGGGGEIFDASMGIPGRLLSPNLTPAGLLSWRDDEILRAFTMGVTPDGRVLFPVMPYPDYGHLVEADALAIVAYLRTLKPIENSWEKSHVNFPMNLLIRRIPQTPKWTEPPPVASDTVAVGKYLSQVAGCLECHTPTRRGVRIAGAEFSGGREFQFPAGKVFSSNISPDVGTGIGTWSRRDFIQKFKSFRTKPVGPLDANTPMPWGMYQGMTEQDLGSIYDYLRTVSPTRNAVERFRPISTAGSS